MVSSALSSRRGLLHRPKVCFTQPNPGRCDPEPRPPGVCSVLPTFITAHPEEDVEFAIYAFNPNYQVGILVDCDCTATEGEFTCEPVYNGISGSGLYIAPLALTSKFLTAEFTWPNGVQCSSQAQVDVIL